MRQPHKYKWTVYIGSWSLTQWLKFLALLVVVVLAANYIAGRTHRSKVAVGTEDFGENGDRQFTGQVVQVVDGDTIDIVREGVKLKVRLFGIDAPEMGQAYGDEAQRFTTHACLGRTVILKSHGMDKYGRILGDIILDDGLVLNRELIRAGLAWWFSKYSDDRTLEDLEQEARRTGVGLWADAGPVAPWDFRSRNKK